MSHVSKKVFLITAILLGIFASESLLLACSQKKQTVDFNGVELNWKANSKSNPNTFNSNPNTFNRFRSREFVVKGDVFKFMGFNNTHAVYSMPTYFCEESGKILDLYRNAQNGWEFMVKDTLWNKITYVTGFNLTHFTKSGTVKKAGFGKIFSVRKKTKRRS